MSLTFSYAAPVDEKSLSSIFKQMRDFGCTKVLELGVANKSCGEVSADFKSVFISMDGSQTAAEMRKQFIKTQCASHWFVVVKKEHEIEKAGMLDFLQPVMKFLSLAR